MKFSTWFVGLAAISLLLPISVFARQKDKDSGNFTLASAAEVGSTQLSPGHYKAEWTGNGSNLQVSILKDKQVVATTPAKLVQGASQDAVVVNSSTNKLEQIDFGKLKEELVLPGQ